MLIVATPNPSVLRKDIIRHGRYSRFQVSLDPTSSPNQAAQLSVRQILRFSFSGLCTTTIDPKGEENRWVRRPHSRLRCRGSERVGGCHCCLELGFPRVRETIRKCRPSFAFEADVLDLTLRSAGWHSQQSPAVCRVASDWLVRGYQVGVLKDVKSRAGQCDLCSQ